MGGAALSPSSLPTLSSSSPATELNGSCFRFSAAIMLRFNLLLLLFLCCCFRGGEGSTFTFVNKCGETVWPGILSNAGKPTLKTTGFELASSASRAVAAPGGWSGRFWARTGCSAAGSAGVWSCATGDCGSGRVECDGAGAAPPTTLAEFTLASPAGRDFYDVSLVDGYNLPVLVEASDGKGCPAAGCLVDVGQRCPAELRVAGQGSACRSACDAFGKPEYCCSGAFASPATCRPTVYSQVFKAACPNSYSYAFDDPTSIFTCSGGADYTITFCPDSVPSMKSSRNSSSSPSSTSTTTSSGSSSTSTSRPAGGMMLGDDPWLADLATDDALPSANSLSFLRHSLILATTACVARILLL